MGLTLNITRIIGRAKKADGCNYFYPFHVSERNTEGKIQKSEVQHIMHGFSIVSDTNVRKRIFDWDSDGLPNGSEVFEIRVRNNCGEWQNWQAIIGDLHIIPIIDWAIGEDMDKLFDTMKGKFSENFEVRRCGILFHSDNGYVQVVNNDDDMIRTINPITLEIEYYPQISNMCYPLENQIDDMIKFRKHYYAYDDNDKRV